MKRLWLSHLFGFLQQVISRQSRQARAQGHGETTQGNQNCRDDNKNNAHGLAACLVGVFLENVGLQAEHFFLFFWLGVVITQ